MYALHSLKEAHLGLPFHKFLKGNIHINEVKKVL